MKDTLKKLANLETQRREIIDQLVEEFNAALKQVFVDNPKLEQIRMYVNNHEFNDGDASTRLDTKKPLACVHRGCSRPLRRPNSDNAEGHERLHDQDR